MNVLVLSAAAKVLLVRAFGEAAHARGGQIFAADLHADNAALFEADRALLLPPSATPDFADTLARICAERKIRMVVPTRDAELPILSAARERFAEAGTLVLAPAPEALARCQDKRRFTQTCCELGLGTPHTYPAGKAPERFPVFVRPVFGSGGRDARRIEAAEDLPNDADLLIQDLETAPEFTIDVLMDLAGHPLQAVARRRLMVRDGEAVKSRVEDQPELVRQSLALCEGLSLVGHNVVQAFYGPGEGVRFIEVNPRFGGASNLSLQAGLASPERILQMAAGETCAAAAPRPIAYGLTMLRYAEDRFVTDADIARVADR